MTNRKRNIGINIRVTPEEKTRIERNADRCRLTVSEYLRQLAMKKNPKELPSEEILESLMRLREVIATLEHQSAAENDERVSNSLKEYAKNIRIILTETMQFMMHQKKNWEKKT